MQQTAGLVSELGSKGRRAPKSLGHSVGPLEKGRIHRGGPRVWRGAGETRLGAKAKV